MISLQCNAHIDEEMATRLSMTIWRIFFLVAFSVSGLNRMVRNGKQFRRFNIGSGHETFGHRVYSRGFDASNSSPAVTLVRLNNPQFFIFLHAYAAFARYWKFKLNKQLRLRKKNTVSQINLLNSGALAFQTFNQLKYTVKPGNAPLWLVEILENQWLSSAPKNLQFSQSIF